MRAGAPRARSLRLVLLAPAPKALRALRRFPYARAPGADPRGLPSDPARASEGRVRGICTAKRGSARVCAATMRETPSLTHISDAAPQVNPAALDERGRKRSALPLQPITTR